MFTLNQNLHTAEIENAKLRWSLDAARANIKRERERERHLDGLRHIALI
ncbi:MAG TPA: hypothetical protein VEF72_24145 [Mycobacterium sp.]|nr:hypothetical protein [Mycobacterium sp.]